MVELRIQFRIRDKSYFFDYKTKEVGDATNKLDKVTEFCREFLEKEQGRETND